MDKPVWTYHFLDNTTFILGNNKNAGKTTFMNLALNRVREVVTPAFLSIGIDGEPQDLIDGRTKPQIRTLCGDILVTTYPMIQKSEGKYKLLKVFPYHTVLGQLVIAETLRAGCIELVGPENNTQLTEVIAYLKGVLGCKHIIIDGAANRKTPLSSIDNSGFFYVFQANKRTLNKVLETCRLLSYCASLPTYNPKTELDPYVVEGAFTTNKLNEIPIEYDIIVIDNLSSVFITYKQLIRLSNYKKLMVKKQFSLHAFVAVLKDIDIRELKERFKENNIKEELIINPYVN